MVSKEKYQKFPEIYVCDSCGFGYVEKQVAQQCEDFCIKHKSCSMEITKKAVKR